ncbi:MAG: neutral/alkaline non-lysosomal ceramidase N-terminal domain-containing protein [Candidatus Hydrogenedentota bacterium]
MRTRILLTLFFAAALLLTTPAIAAEFQAGAATSNITPPLGTSLAGHMRDRAATDIHDELHARCLVLDNGSTRLAFVLVDSCMVPRDTFDAAKARASEASGIPPAHMLMAATHSHTAACATPVFQSDPTPEYNAFLTQRIADGIVRAKNNLQPARIGWGVGKVEGEVFNRRWHMEEDAIPPNPFGGQDKVKMNPPRGHDALIEPAGPVDTSVHVLAAQTPEGLPIALLANYSLHYVGGTAGPEVSADYFGYFARMAETELSDPLQEPGFVAMLSNGASGDINNIDFTKPSESKAPYEQMKHVARRVADEAVRIYADIEWRDQAALDAAVKDIARGVRKPDTDALERAREILEEAGGEPLTTLPQIYARETVLLAEYPDTVDVPLQVVRIGELGIAAIPCEVFCEIGLAVREASPFDTTFTIELANGYNGYLPTAKQHALGGYETWRARSSYLDEAAADKISKTVRGLFEAIMERPEHVAAQ